MPSNARPLRDRLVADGIYTFAFRIANMALAALLGIVTARALGPHGRGIFALPMVDAALVSASYAGLSSATSFFLLRHNAGRGIVRPALWSGAALVVIGALATVAIAFAAHTPWAAIPAMLSLPGPAALMLATGYAVGTHRVRINPGLVFTSTGMLFTAMLLAFAIAGRTPNAAIIAWVTSGDLLAMAIVAWILADARTLDAGSVSFRDFAGYVGRTGSVNLVSLLNYRADVYIVALFTTPTLLGMYTLAVAAAETLLTATQVSAVVSSPHVGSMERAAAAELTARCVRHNVLVASVCCGALALLAPFLVHLLYGAAFLPMVPALRVLLIGVFALSLGSPMSSYFTLRLGRPEVALVLASLSAAMCIVTSVLLVPRMGLVGAAIGSTVAYVLSQSLGIMYFAATSGIGATRLLIPRARDIAVFVDVAIGFARRLRRA